MLNKEQERFNKWYSKVIGEFAHPALYEAVEEAWEAALEPEVVSPYEKLINPMRMPFIDWESRPWAVEVRMGYCAANTPPNQIGDRIMTIARPDSAWEPKNGEVVLFNHNGKTSVGVWYDGIILFDDYIIETTNYKFFDYKTDQIKIGKPWNEI